MKCSRLLVLMAMLVAACGGGETAGSTAGDDPASATTAAPVATTVTPDDDQSVSGLEDMPAECREAFVAFLHEIEPMVEGIDFENSTPAELEALNLELEDVSSAFDEEAGSLNCPDLDPSEDSFADLAEFAEQEAPGTAGYFRMIATFAGAAGGGTSASGDCETDIAAMQAIVDEGGTMGGMTMGELAAVTSLLGSIGTNCTLDRQTEFYQQEDVSAFMSG